MIAAKEDIADYYLNGLKTLDEPVKIVDPEWNDWLKENQHLVKHMGLRRNRNSRAYRRGYVYGFKKTPLAKSV